MIVSSTLLVPGSRLVGLIVGYNGLSCRFSKDLPTAFASLIQTLKRNKGYWMKHTAKSNLSGL